MTTLLILLAIILGILLAAALPFWHLRRKPPTKTESNDSDDRD
jgi:hypothetical protein